MVVPAIARLLRRYREVDVELALRDHGSDLFGDGIDVAVRMGPQPDSGLIARRIGTTAMHVCGAPAYLQRKGTPRSALALLRHERIGFAVHGRVLPWRLRDGDSVREVAPSRRLVVNTGDAVIDLAAAGVGLAWMCDFMMWPSGGGLVEVVGDSQCETSPLYALALPTRHMLPKVRVFIDLVVAELARRGAATEGRVSGT